MTSSDPPRLRRRERTQAAILKAARKIIRTEGIDALSIRKVAAAIDYSPAAIYDYFSGKDDLVAAVRRGSDARLEGYLDSVSPAMPVMEQLVELGMAYIRFAIENEEEFLAQFSNPGRTLARGERPSGAFAVLHGAIVTAIESGAIGRAPFDALAISYAAWAFVHGMATLRLTSLRNADVDFDPINRWALERFFAGMSG